MRFRDNYQGHKSLFCWAFYMLVETLHYKFLYDRTFVFWINRIINLQMKCRHLLPPERDRIFEDQHICKHL